MWTKISLRSCHFFTVIGRIPSLSESACFSARQNPNDFQNIATENYEDTRFDELNGIHSSLINDYAELRFFLPYVVGRLD